MPSPLGHALAGATVHVLTARDAVELRRPRRIAWVLGAAVAPDLDLLLRFVDGRNHHQHEMHSIGFAALAALAALLLAGEAGRMRLAGAVGVAWLSHLLLDYLSVDTSPPIGLMALWPFSQGWFKFPWPIFLDIGRTLGWATVRHDAAAIAWEAFLMAPVLAGAAWIRRSLLHSPSAGAGATGMDDG